MRRMLGFALLLVGCSALPDDFAEVTVEVGKRISDAACDDLVINGGPKVQETWTAISGTVEATVVPSTEGGQPTVEIHLSEVVFESPRGKQVTLESFSWE